MSVVKCSRTRGFTLVETMVAISILLIAVVGPISLIGDSLHKIYYAKDEIVAINLAQEGIEIIRQKRDSNMLSGVGLWDANFNAPTDYIVDAITPSITNCSSCDKKVYLDSDGYYRQGSVSVATQFTRWVTVANISGGSEDKVTSTVTWKTGGQLGTISVSENLFKWAR